jgi:hypothetical protein
MHGKATTWTLRRLCGTMIVLAGAVLGLADFLSPMGSGTDLAVTVAVLRLPPGVTLTAIALPQSRSNPSSLQSPTG